MNKYSQLRRFGLFDANVPRYTSYPPASQFANDVTPARHSGWLSQIPAGARVSIYLHVPFCKRLCWFCACRTQGCRSDATLTAYVDALIQEIATLRAALPQGVVAGRIHWGGGTPTLLPPAEITRVANALKDAFPYGDDAEISVEVDPNEIDEARMDALAAMGMNRASIGVQDFDPVIQKIIGREQTFDVTRDVIEGLRVRGITSLHTDILYGLPRQTRAGIAASVQMLMALSPDRVALYGYAHVPWMAKRQALIPSEELPRPEDRLRLFETAREGLLWDGYTALGIDHFARPDDSLTKAAQTGRLRRNFQGYSDDTCDVLLGLGASAVSRFPQGYVQNAPGTATYQAAIKDGTLATTRGHTFTKDDVLRARMIEMLMCDFHIDVARLQAEGLGPMSEITALLDRIVAQFAGQVTFTSSGIEIPKRARLLTRVIARHLDVYESQTEGHPSAI